ncbi:MAG: metallophosphoesterase family protein, partial [Planctomycetes bacterium]|nr:metallophosphoesterase family protein [Planctomycetota bacterium]
LTSFDRCLECEALGARAIWLAGTACAAIGEFERAEFEMSRAMAAMSRRTPSHYLARAAVQRQLSNGGVDRAVDGIDAGMLELGPIVTLVDRAVELEIARGRHAEALTRIDSVIRRLTRRASWLARRAEVLEHLERPLEAAATRRAAVSEIDALPPRHRDSRATRELRRAIVAAGPLADSGSIELVPLPRRDLGAARAVTAPLPTFTNLVPYGSTWEYLDDGSDPGTAWRDVSFAPTVPWSTGAAPLGYGDNEATAISFGPNPAARYITYYFRHVFSVTGAAALTGARFRLVRDDGAVVYLNGVEVGRTNMPGSSDATTLAPLDVDGLYEGVPHDLILDHSLLVDGDNVLAVEVHQSSPSSADLRFDGEFLVNDEIVTLTRGPYLQRVSPDSAVIRWRTSGATDSSVWIGPAPGSLVVAATDPALRSDHEVLVSGLAAATDYYYAVGSVGGMLAGDTADHSFRTHPTIGSSVPTRIWAIGDSGTANLDAGAVRDAYLGYAAGAHTDVWLMLGDNAYFSGFDLEYQVAVFDMYSELLRNTCVWPTIGNHDAYTADSDSMTGAYYDIFTLPMAGESGGLASGTEAYYSFDHGDIHFVCLDSQDTDRSATGAMFTWLRQDLQNTLANWVIAFWHHPPYSKGSHDTDNPFDSGGRSWDMRGEALPILEEAGVDLVLCGHSHSYERSYLLNGHYKTSSTLAPEHVLDSGDGDPAVDGEYAKATLGIAPAEGAVYVVAGSSGIVGPGTLDHPAMCV